VGFMHEKGMAMLFEMWSHAGVIAYWLANSLK
jgi:hypothetical protein